MDGIRFLCIAWVFVFHVSMFLVLRSPGYSSSSVLVQVVNRGWVGVELFFALSGFILAVPFAAARILPSERQVDLPKYYMRRLTRLEPPYIVALTLFMLIAALSGETCGYCTTHLSLAPLLAHFGAGLFYLHGPIFGDINPINGILWSLEVEVQFYLLMPVLAGVFLVKGRWRRRAVIVGAMVVAAALQQRFIPQGTPFSETRLALSLANYIQYFLVGFLAADVFLVEWRRSTSKHVSWDLVAVLSWAGLLAVLWTSLPGSRLLVCLPILGIVLSGFKGRYMALVVRNRWLYTIGGMCYSIYLLHQRIIWFLTPTIYRWVGHHGPVVDLIVLAVIVGAFTLVLSALFFVVIERPCMDKNWPRRLAAKYGLWTSSPRAGAGIGVSHR